MIILTNLLIFNLRVLSFILDLGCSPGGWLQVSRKFAPNNSKILGIDKINMKSIPNVEFLQNDIFDNHIFKKIESFFDGKKINLILIRLHFQL